MGQVEGQVVALRPQGVPTVVSSARPGVVADRDKVIDAKVIGRGGAITAGRVERHNDNRTLARCPGGRGRSRRRSW